MNKMPVISGKQLIKVLNRLGYSIIKQRGSHIKMQKKTPVGTHSITVPQHYEIAKGTLSDIINKVSLWNQISKEELLAMLREI